MTSSECSEVAFCCVCTQPADHPDSHRCPCGGRWTGSIDGSDFVTVALPGTDPEWDPYVQARSSNDR